MRNEENKVLIKNEHYNLQLTQENNLISGKAIIPLTPKSFNLISNDDEILNEFVLKSNDTKHYIMSIKKLFIELVLHLFK